MAPSRSRCKKMAVMMCCMADPAGESSLRTPSICTRAASQSIHWLVSEDPSRHQSPDTETLTRIQRNAHVAAAAHTRPQKGAESQQNETLAGCQWEQRAQSIPASDVMSQAVWQVPLHALPTVPRRPGGSPKRGDACARNLLTGSR